MNSHYHVPLPETLDCPLLCDFDSGTATAYQAANAGQITRVCKRPGDTIQKNEIIAYIVVGQVKTEIDTIRRAKKQAEFANAKRREKLHREARQAARILESLGYTDAQVQEMIHFGVDPIAIPLRAEFGGVLTQCSAAETLFAKGDSVYSIATQLVFCAAISTEHALFIRHNKTGAVFTASGANLGDVMVVRQMPGSLPGSVNLGLKLQKRFSIESACTVRFRFEPYERLGHDLTKHDYPYPILPRGSEAVRLGLIKPYKKAAPTPSVHEQNNPFRYHTDTRPDRDAAPYNPPHVLKVADRHEMTLSLSEWQRLKISATQLIPHSICEQVHAIGCAEKILPAEICSVPAGYSGEFQPLGFVIDGPIEAGEILGHIRFSADILDAQKSLLNRANPIRLQDQLEHVLKTVGFTNRDLASLRNGRCPLERVPVFARRSGVLKNIRCSHAVRATDDIATITTFRAALFKVRLGKFGFAHQGVRFTIFRHSTPGPLCEGWAFLDTSDDGFSSLTVPAGRGAETGPVDLKLQDAYSMTTALCLPRDCVYRIGKSNEILLHTSDGTLTPMSVELGCANDDIAEIVTEIPGHARVIRDVHALTLLHPLLKPLLLGFWNPQAYRLSRFEQKANYLYRSNPLLHPPEPSARGAGAEVNTH